MTTERTGETIRVDVVYAVPERAWSWTLELPAGAVVEHALLAAELGQRVPGAVIDRGLLAVFGRPVTPTDALRDGDRIEILRPLQADPKQARRSRAATGPRR
ncbi:RnfH family protein [Arenimonas sp.]|uniref:RnfH family protein n=1 Tax=Arenimonas sp. TaxID=1872635 RepID=UPI0039E25126